LTSKERHQSWPARPFRWIFLLLSVIIVALGGLGLLTTQQHSAQSGAPPNWTTYHNDKWGVSLRHPPDWHVKELKSPISHIMVQGPNDDPPNGHVGIVKVAVSSPDAARDSADVIFELFGSKREVKDIKLWLSQNQDCRLRNHLNYMQLHCDLQGPVPIILEGQRFITANWDAFAVKATEGIVLLMAFQEISRNPALENPTLGEVMKSIFDSVKYDEAAVKH
jgi:hypothetical protein